MNISRSEIVSRKRLDVFCCYAHKDQQWLLELKTHLAPLQREELIILWDDMNVYPGDEWEEVILRRLDSAHIILLLVSPHFIASDYGYSVEMRRAMERHERGEARVIPIILHLVSWKKTPFGKLQALPTPARAITSSYWSHPNEAFYTVVTGIRKIVEASERRSPLDMPSWAFGEERHPNSPGRIQPQRHPYHLLRRHVWSAIVLILLLLSGLLLGQLTPSLPLPDMTSSAITPSSTTKLSLSGSTDVITPGILTVGSDTSYPPLEYVDPTTRQASGFDIELIKVIAKQMGLNAVIITANFDTIMPDLNGKRFDVVISSQRITEAREKQVDFVPYFESGLSLLVQKGNPLDIHSLGDLCGQPIGVENGTIEFDVAQDATKRYCEKTGKNNIRIISETDQTEVIRLLANGDVTATFQDAPVTTYYYKNSPDLFEGVGTVILAGPEGISIRKGDTSMLHAIQKAFDAVKADGTYDRLFRQWQLNPDQKI